MHCTNVVVYGDNLFKNLHLCDSWVNISLENMCRLSLNENVYIILLAASAFLPRMANDLKDYFDRYVSICPCGDISFLYNYFKWLYSGMIRWPSISRTIHITATVMGLVAGCQDNSKCCALADRPLHHKGTIAQLLNDEQ
jgi:hypothetical protein